MSGPWRKCIVLKEDEYRELRMRMMFEHCKFDPQAEDVESLSRVALVMDRAHWLWVCEAAQKLSTELLQAEQEILARPALLGELAIPRPIVKALRSDLPAVSAARVMRFDFHYSDEGWRITEVNSDVPGGFIEGSAYCAMVAEGTGRDVLGNPAAAYARAMAKAASGEVVGLVHATGYMDDRQVMMFLARELEACGVRAVLCAPDQVDWQNGEAVIETAWYRGPVQLLMRFFPAEWLPNLPRRSGWRGFFAGTRTPQSNPGYALISQSKRLPLLFEKMTTRMPTWQALLPQTCDPRMIRGQSMAAWVLKPAMGRVGDGVLLEGATAEKEARAIRRSARWFPRHWIAQRRFETTGVETGTGMVYPCLGVYTVDGVAAGAYARVSATPLVDWRASDAAVVLETAGETMERIKGAA